MNGVRRVFQRLTASGQRGLKAWLVELSWFLGPLVRWASPESGKVFIALSPDGHFDSHAARSQNDSGNSLDGDGSAPSSWQKLVVARTVVISLHSSQVNCLRIDLPRAAASNLVETVGYRLITESPIDPRQISFDAKLLRVPSLQSRRFLTVEVALCSKALVEQIQARLDAAGVSQTIVGYSVNGRLPLDFVFKVSHTASGHLRGARLQQQLLVTASVALFGALPIEYTIARWNTHKTEIKIALLREAEHGLVEIGQQRDLIASARNELAVRSRLPRFSTLLNELSVTLPASAWLQEVRYESAGLRVTGLSTETATTADSLRRSSLISSVRLESVAATAESPRAMPSRFTLSATIVSTPAKIKR